MRSEGGFVSRVDFFTQLWTLLCVLAYFPGAVDAQDHVAQHMTPATSVQQRVVITVNANLRAQPSMRGAILDVIQAKTVVQLLNKSGSWEQIQTDSGTSGWVHSSLLAPFQKAGILHPTSSLVPASSPQHGPNEQQAAAPGTGQSTSPSTRVAKKPLIFPAPDPSLRAERAQHAPPAQRAPLLSARREIFLAPDSPMNSDGTAAASLPPARREIFLAPDSSTDIVQPIFPEDNIPTRPSGDRNTNASAGQVPENTDEPEVSGLFGSSRLLYILAALLVGGLGILVFQVKKAWEIKQNIYVFEQNTRYPTLAWETGDGLKPFLPPTPVEQHGEARHTDQDVPPLTSEYQDNPLLQRAEASLAGQDEDMQRVEAESFIDSIFLETVEEDSHTDSPVDSSAIPLVEPREFHSPAPERHVLRSDEPAYSPENPPTDDVPENNERVSPEQESRIFPVLPDVSTDFSVTEKAVLEAMFTQEEISEHTLKEMLDTRGFSGMLLKAVVGDLIRKTGSDGMPWIRVHYTQGVFHYQLQHLPTHPNSLGVANYVNGQEQSTNG